MLFAIFLAQYAFQWDAYALLENLRNIVKTQKNKKSSDFGQNLRFKSTSECLTFFWVFSLIRVNFDSILK